MVSIIRKKVERTAILLAVLTSLFPSTSAFAAVAPVVTILTPQITKDLGSPVAIAFDPRGYYFVADPRMGGISKFDLAGRLVQVLKVKAPAQGVALDASGNLLVSQGKSVVVLDPKGVQLGMLGTGIGEFKQSAGIAVDVRGYIFVVDSAANNVKVFTAARKLVKTIGSTGAANGQFYLPTGISYEKSTDQVVVSDTGNHRVQFFSATGNYNFLKTIGIFGKDPLQFKSPVDVAFDYDSAGKLNRMYVADLFLNRVQVIDPAGGGAFLSYIGTGGLVNGLLMVPMDLAFDTVNRRLIVVNGNGHLMLFGIDGGGNPGLSQGLVLDPVPATVTTATITLSGTVPANANVVVTTDGTAIAGPVAYTSSNTWKATVSNLAPGSNVVTAAATAGGTVLSTQSVGIIYAAP